MERNPYPGLKEYKKKSPGTIGLREIGVKLEKITRLFSQGVKVTIKQSNIPVRESTVYYFKLIRALCCSLTDGKTQR